jgi:hypothetical protein
MRPPVRLLGFLLALLPMAQWAWNINMLDRCGLEGEAWAQCRGQG